MKIVTKPLGPVQANCYLIIDNHHSIIIDPGAEYIDIDLILKENECDLEAVLLTLSLIHI